MRYFIATMLIITACSDPEIVVERPCSTCDAVIYVEGWDASGPEVWTPEEGSPTCIADNNGVITAGEMPVVIGAVVGQVMNKPGQPALVNPSGAADGDDWLWDLSQVGSGDVKTWMKVVDPADTWYAESFPEATNATPVSPADPSILGIYRTGDGRIELLGIASVEDGPGRTLLVYDDPVILFTFPLQLGKTWSQTVTFSDAWLQGVKNAGTEDYLLAVDGRGTVRLPQMTLENTLRVRMKVRQTFAVGQDQPSVERIYYFWVHECLGEVARMISMPGESDADFSTAAEYRRLAL